MTPLKPDLLQSFAKRIKGLTLIEVLFVSLLLGFFSVVAGQALVNLKTFDVQIDQKIATYEALLNTLIQLRAAPYSSVVANFSTLNSCRTRIYSLTGAFQSDAGCSSVSSTPGIYVRVTRRDTTLDTVEFKNPDGSINPFLKLPRHDGAVLAFEVESTLRPNVGPSQSFSMTIYRR